MDMTVGFPLSREREVGLDRRLWKDTIKVTSDVSTEYIMEKNLAGSIRLVSVNVHL